MVNKSIKCLLTISWNPCCLSDVFVLIEIKSKTKKIQNVIQSINQNVNVVFLKTRTLVFFY